MVYVTRVHGSPRRSCHTSPRAPKGCSYTEAYSHKPAIPAVHRPTGPSNSFLVRACEATKARHTLLLRNDRWQFNVPWSTRVSGYLHRALRTNRRDGLARARDTSVRPACLPAQRKCAVCAVCVRLPVTTSRGAACLPPSTISLVCCCCLC